MQGKIIKGIAGFYYIYAENDEIYECKAKGIFRKDKQKPLVGDNVEIEVLDAQEKEGSVTAILPRKEFADPSGGCQCRSGFCDFCDGESKTKFYAVGQISDHDGKGECSGSYML